MSRDDRLSSVDQSLESSPFGAWPGVDTVELYCPGAEPPVHVNLVSTTSSQILDFTSSESFVVCVLFLPLSFLVRSKQR